MSHFPCFNQSEKLFESHSGMAPGFTESGVRHVRCALRNALLEYMYKKGKLACLTCVPLAGYRLLMTPQREVLKHLGHANFDGNRSAELK